MIRIYVQTDERVKSGDPLFDIDPTLYDASLRNARAQFDAAAAAAGTAADELKAAATKLEEKRAALEDALKTYREAKDAQKPDQPPSDQLTTAEKGWQDALQGLQGRRGRIHQGARQAADGDHADGAASRRRGPARQGDP